MQKVTKAILPVGGYGTRFLPATKAQPKEMLPLVDKPVIQFLVEEAVASGIKEIIFVTGKNKRAIEDHFDFARELDQELYKKGKKDLLKVSRELSKLAKFAYVRQKEPKGNADAVLQAEHLIGNDPVAVMFGDDLVFGNVPALKQLIDVYAEYGDPVVSVETVPKNDVSRYGVIKGQKVGKNVYRVTGTVEKPSPSEAPSRQAVAGKYILTPDVFKVMKKMKPVNGEIGCTETFGEYAKTRAAYAVEPLGKRYDCGSKIGYLKATIAYGLEHPETKNELRRFLKSIT